MADRASTFVVTGSLVGPFQKIRIKTVNGEHSVTAAFLHLLKAVLNSFKECLIYLHLFF